MIKKSLQFMVLLGASASFSANAVICLAKQYELPVQNIYSATNCHYFSGSKELRINRSGSLFNYNLQGNYDDQLQGHSFIYCPIILEESGSKIESAQIAVSDLNTSEDIVCQMGQSQYTKNGFAAYWGATAKSQSYGKQHLVSQNANRTDEISMPNSFITCSLPPQDHKDKQASSLIAYSVKRKN